MEKLSKDKALQGELQAAQSSALHELLKAKGLEEEAGKAATEAMLRFAADHGLALTAEDLEPTKRFEPGGAPESILSFARERLKGTLSLFLLVFLITLITAAAGLLTPAFGRFFVDRLLTGHWLQWTFPFFLLLGIMNLWYMLPNAL